MARGNKLSQFEQGQIVALRGLGTGVRAIARQLGRSHHVVQNFLADTSGYGQKKSSGRKRKLSKRDERRIGKEASNSAKSCNEIKRELDLDVSKTTIWRAIDRNPNIVRQKMMAAPRLLPRHKDARMEFARKNMDRSWILVSKFDVYLN